jgi:hypothetical protein
MSKPKNSTPRRRRSAKKLTPSFAEIAQRLALSATEHLFAEIARRPRAVSEIGDLLKPPSDRFREAFGSPLPSAEDMIAADEPARPNGLDQAAVAPASESSPQRTRTKSKPSRMPSEEPAALTREEKRAINWLKKCILKNIAAGTRTKRDLAKADCLAMFPDLSGRAFKEKVWPRARRAAGLSEKAPSGRPKQ